MNDMHELPILSFVHSYASDLGLLFAYVHFYRTLCTSGLSNVPEILQFHDCNVTFNVLGGFLSD